MRYAERQMLYNKIRVCITNRCGVNDELLGRGCMVICFSGMWEPSNSNKSTYERKKRITFKTKRNSSDGFGKRNKILSGELVSLVTSSTSRSSIMWIQLL